MAKKLDIKQALINHVEKIVFGAVVLVGVIGLAQTDWSPYGKAPVEVADKIRDSKKKLYGEDGGRTWPAEDKSTYIVEGDKLPKVIVEKELFAPLNIAQYQFSNKFLRVLGANRDPVTEPVLKAPEDIIVSAARVFIKKPDVPPELESEKEGDDLAMTADDKAKVDDNVDDEFATRTQGSGAGMQGGAGGGYEGGDFYAPELSSYGGGMDYPGMSGAEGMTGGLSGDPSLGAYGTGLDGAYPGSGMATSIKMNGQGYHYASVRAIFPLRDQIKNYADAIHRSYAEASRTFQIIDFELERQARLPGDDPWTGPWEKVDIKVAQDVLDSCDYLESDVVNSMVTDSVITMPLPSRMTGIWKNHATHPRIEKFELSEKEIQLEMDLNRRLLKEFTEQKKTETQGLVRKGGFSNQLYDPKAVQAALIGGAGSMYTGGYEGGMMGAAPGGAYGGGGGGGYGGGAYGSGSYGSGAYGSGAAGYPGGAGGFGGAGRGPRGPAGQTKEEDPGMKLMKILQEEIKSETNDPKRQKEIEETLKSWITKRVTAAGDLLLFRYIDFDVEPGKTYRYRVRFILNNPNFNRRISEAGGLAHVVEGATRTTPWSEASAPVHVEDSLSYFITNVSQKSNRVMPAVTMDMFQWDATYGTYMNHTVDVQMGQTIGGDEITEVIRPAEMKSEKEKYTFESDDYLVDAIADLNIDPEYHSGEKVPAELRLKLHGRKFALPGVALVETGDDGLSMFDGTSREKEHNNNKDKMASQAKQFKYITDKAAGVAEGGDAYSGYPGLGADGGSGGYDDMGMMGYGGDMMGMGGRNSNRKASRTKSGHFIRSGGAGGAGGGAGGAYGSGAPGGAFGSGGGRR